MTAAADLAQANAEFNDACDALAHDPKQADVLKIRMATCQHCNGWVLQSAYPRCEKDKESQKEFAKCLKAGNNISTVTLTEARKVEYCSCPE